MPKIEISDAIYNNLDKICEALGQDPEKFAQNAIYQAMLPYMTHDENSWDLVVHLEPAIYVSGNTRFSRQMAEQEGREVVTNEIPCLLIERCSIFGAPYCKIIMNGQCMKVPADCIKFPEK